MFGGRTKIYVASSLYNLAGDIEKLVPYRRSVVAGAIIQTKPLADTIWNAYAYGPAARLKQYATWAHKDNGYAQFLEFTGTAIHTKSDINPSLFLPFLDQKPPEGDKEFHNEILSFYLGGANYDRWVEQYLLEHDPDLVRDSSNTSWEYDFKEDLNLIEIKDSSQNLLYSFTPQNFDKRSKYIYIYYRVDAQGHITHTEGDGTWADDPLPWELEPPDAWLYQWELLEDTSITTELKSNEVHTEIHRSKATGEETVVSTTPYSHVIDTKDIGMKKWKRVDFVGSNRSNNPDLQENEEVFYGARTSIELEPFESQTVTYEDADVIHILKITGSKEYVVGQSSTLTNWRAFLEHGPIQLYIYKEGTDAQIDAYFNLTETNKEYLPPIPLRVDNKFTTEMGNPDLVSWTKKAYRKAYNGRIEKVLKQLEDNSQLNELDYVFIDYGVPLNTPSKYGKQYIFEFFDAIHETLSNDLEYLTWLEKWNAYKETVNAYLRWTDLNYGDKPDIDPFPTPPTRSVLLKAKHDFQTELKWSFIEKTIELGKYKPELKKGDVILEAPNDDIYDPVNYPIDSDGERSIRYTSSWEGKILVLVKQKEFLYEKISIRGLEHVNHVYGGKHVHTTVEQALKPKDNPDDPHQDTGFLVPIHHPTFKKTLLVDATEMAYVSSFLVINTYKKVRRRWYQTGLFRIVSIIIVAIISVISGGLGAIGILGSNFSVGAALGLGTGTLAAAIAGAIINSLAAFIVSNIVVKVAQKVLGGSLLGNLLVSLVALWANNGFSLQSLRNSFSSMFSNLTSASNLLRLTDAVSGLVRGLLNAQMQGDLASIQSTIAQTEEINRRIDNLMDVGALINPDLHYERIMNETPEQFFSRTQATATDIIEASHALVNNFAEITLALPQP